MKENRIATHILLVEDNPRHAELISEEIEDVLAGVSVDVAGSAGEARAAVAAGTPYDALLIDLRLPDGDGVTLLRQLREAGERAPAVFVSTASAAPQAVEALKSGASDYLLKDDGYLGVLPYTVAAVIERVRTANARAADAANRTSADLLGLLGGVFLATADHLDTQVAGISEGLSDGTKAGLDRACQHLLELEGAVERMRAWRRRATPAPWTVTELIERVVRSVTDTLREKRLRLRIGLDDAPGAVFRRSREPMELLSSHLLRNAIHYAPAESEIEVRVAAVSDGRELEIRVSDDGPCVPSHCGEGAFRPLAMSRATGEIGRVELFIARSLARALGGGAEALAREKGATLRAWVLVDRLGPEILPPGEGVVLAPGS